MLPDRVSNPGPLTYESGALPIALRGPALSSRFDKLVMLKIALENGTLISVFKLYAVIKM